jgi:hypothetical protein
MPALVDGTQYAPLLSFENETPLAGPRSSGRSLSHHDIWRIVLKRKWVIVALTIIGAVPGSIDSGVYPQPGARTLPDRITMTGGLDESSSKTIRIIHRSEPAKVMTVRRNVFVPSLRSMQPSASPPGMRSTRKRRISKAVNEPHEKL